MQTLIKEWRMLKPALLILLLVILLGAGLIVAGYYFSAQQADAKARQVSQEQAARLKLMSSGAEKAMIEQYLPAYQSLITRGFVGEERRIEWVDLLREIQRQYKLFGISYAISQQENYQPPFIPQTGGFILHRSVMKLDLDMLHEGDIINLTQSLANAGTSPFLLRECEITRTQAVMSQQLLANMHAKCELDWLTLREPVKLEVN